ncbi:MAG: Holliday junction resolvase RuvX [Chloroflexi bacterium]|nr:Holliday junction resolvase RuvX [Chloroflexota bacterium]
MHSDPPHTGRPAIPGKLMALDVGLARIGVAVCDPLQLAARPLTVLSRKSRQEDFALLAKLVQQEEVQAILCGLPLNMDGSEGAQAQIVRRWARRLHQALHQKMAPPPILFWDERLSSYMARAPQPARSQRTADDARAAAVILQSYLDTQKLPTERGRTDYGQIGSV